MENNSMEEPKDLVVLGAIRNGNKKFDKIKKATQIDAEELNSILEKLEEKGMIDVEEKKGWLGKKIEIKVTDKGSREIDERVHELQEKWNQMSLLYKSGDKQKLQQYMDDNKSFLPMMMFFGVMDMMMFSMMFSMIGMSMSDYVPPESIPDGMEGGEGMDGAEDFGDGGFDIDIGF
ncbi:winged helix-turn-helix transcriptional regulator [Nitrosopumilus sp. K4]|uniref:winged helix-turn-helix transcriptional regulator n=1 Tax=Nitrosopumilus sp. K4 TaxID=2795383 RepID=UPI001BADD299|nr:winged helix-turn-helix transcriptional regulator [Nitrosopumilus sp. K4]QUC65213.1 winged helix-turn-helix transcriptional regulator [Nitrosopumilus sp. K4]